jgi:dienelactone hydrolase
MRDLGLAGAAACVAIALTAGPLHAQTAAAAPRFETEPFSGSDLLNGKRIAEAECAALPSAVWVVVDKQGECIRYYHSAAGGAGPDVAVYLNTDAVAVNGRGEAKPNDYYIKEGPAAVQNGSISWSRNLKMPYLFVGRPGTYGSSGDHGQRRTAREIEIVSAALDAIKARHRYTRLHLVGYQEGGHTAAALMERRTDLGCVVLASSLLSVRSRLAEFGLTEDVTGNKNPVDPVALVGQVVKRPDLRVFVVTDPDDVVISARSQTIYARRAVAAGLPVRHIFAAARDVYAHELWREAREIVASCVKGVADDTIVSTYQNKQPQTPPDADDPPLHPPDTLTRGVAISEAQCDALKTALWVRVDGRGFCIRYWISTAGGTKDAALVFFNGDIGGVENGKISLNVPSTRVTAGSYQREAQVWSRIYGGPYVALGRIGTLGSSGNHLRERRSLLEARVAMAALDALQSRYGFKRFHAVGQSGGGHTVAAMLQMRTDVGCAVMASGVMSVKSMQRDAGLPVNALVKSRYDPIDFVGAMKYQPGRRMIVISDPDDHRVSFRSQREFVERVKAAGLPILHIVAAAGDENFHGLSSQGHRVAADCARDVDDDALIAKYQNKTAPVAKPSTASRARP